MSQYHIRRWYIYHYQEPKNRVASQWELYKDHQKCPENGYFSPEHNILVSYPLPNHGQGHSGENTDDNDETTLNDNTDLVKTHQASIFVT